MMYVIPTEIALMSSNTVSKKTFSMGTEWGKINHIKSNLEMISYVEF